MSGPERGAYSYRNLDLWQRAQDLALAVVKMSESLPKSEAAGQLHDEGELLRGGLTRQMKALEARLRSQPKALREEESSYLLEGPPE